MISFGYFVHLANYSDGVLYLLMLLFMVEMAVIFDRGWYLRNAIRKGKKILWGISARGKLRRPDLEDLVTMSKGLPEESLLTVALRHFNLIHQYGRARG
ncbi:MAG: MotA/TolQ/ExbB proton channel family protein, partial [Acidithiobacillus sp.]